ncbi:MAG: uncharacterized protein KVP18_001439 [Porospora cf. gigantea A]|nr:MAG: hypothetical protein KVP18_001439 [Porospora cf. gigantea A]
MKCLLPFLSMSNHLHSVRMNFIPDGSDGHLAAMDNLLTLQSPQGTPLNARLDPAVEPTHLYFETTVVEGTGNLAVGFVREAEFLPGWKTRGMFYNGNLSNGSSLVKGSFGPFPQKGDKVGVMVVRTDALAEMVVYVNGRCLGVGFRVPMANDTILFPAIHVSGELSVRIEFPESLPTVIDRERETFSDPYEGEWALEHVFHGAELHPWEIPEPCRTTKPIWHLSKSANSTYRLSIKVGNGLGTEVTVLGQDEGFLRVQLGPFMGTMMYPGPELAKMEQFISAEAPTVMKANVTDDTLIFTGPSVEFHLSRYHKVFTPASSYS